MVEVKQMPHTIKIYWRNAMKDTIEGCTEKEAMEIREIYLALRRVKRVEVICGKK